MVECPSEYSKTHWEESSKPSLQSKLQAKGGRGPPREGPLNANVVQEQVPPPVPVNNQPKENPPVNSQNPNGNYKGEKSWNNTLNRPTWNTNSWNKNSCNNNIKGKCQI